ncbi:hypothetical protein CAC42_8146 [Sphaceloma murrayae]|uniref:Transmembrane 9 superfamily member n=1 Tax=Sphaceloma murrayae TaxID=2082308 RepID=A0A2K1QJ06_9PEZI|nr:hypothetical protein CAC42_8146 [Sphaceloma murrayae]
MSSDFRIRSWLLVIVSLSLWTTARAFYVPGWSIKSYADGEKIPLFVNKVYSDFTQLQYAFSELPFVCPPKGKARAPGFISGSSVALNLGEVLRGDRIVVSDYDLEMGKDDEIHYLCSQTVDEAGLRKAQEVVRDAYVAEWIVDNLPGATSFVTVDKTRKYYASGFKMGYSDYSPKTGRPRYFLNNHVTLVIRYHRAPGADGDRGKKVIVGFEVYAKSVSAEGRRSDGLPEDIHDVRNGLELTFGKSKNVTLDDGEQVEVEQPMTNLTIPYTYSVYFREEDKVEWSNRWDLYFVNQDDNSKTHWLAIVNSLVISGFLTAVVAVILARTIRGDIKGYKDGSLEDGKFGLKKLRGTRSPRESMEKGGLLERPDVDAESESASDEELVVEDTTGWKLCHADAFRTPAHSSILAPLVGSGMQLVFMTVGLIVLSCFGVLNPSFRGGYVSVGTALFVIAGLFSGYFSARVFKTFGGTNWRRNCFVTATLFPGLMFATVFLLNLFVWAQASSTALPLGTLIGLAALWLLVQLPLVYAGSWLGFVKIGAYIHPIKASAIPRQIPQQSVYTRSTTSALLAGLIPFAVIFIELIFLFESVWQDKSGYYYVFGFLAVIGAVLVAVIMEVTIVAVYLQLCAENYHWWWQSFFVGGSSAIWVFAYSVYYYFNVLHVQGFVSSLLFFAYSFLACTVYGLLTGTIGFLTAYAFVRRIYGAIKAD